MSHPVRNIVAATALVMGVETAASAEIASANPMQPAVDASGCLLDAGQTFNQASVIQAESADCARLQTLDEKAGYLDEIIIGSALTYAAVGLARAAMGSASRTRRNTMGFQFAKPVRQPRGSTPRR